MKQKWQRLKQEVKLSLHTDVMLIYVKISQEFTKKLLELICE